MASVPQLADYQAAYLDAKQQYVAEKLKISGAVGTASSSIIPSSSHMTGTTPTINGAQKVQQGGSQIPVKKRPYIVHIVGEAGSGKSTLGAKLAKLVSPSIVEVIELDDIQGAIIARLLSNRNNDEHKKILNPQSNLDAFFEYVSYHAARELRDLISKVSSKCQLIILVGFTIPVGELVDCTYVINVDAETLYRQLTLRTVHEIHAGYKQIRDLLETESNFKIIDLMLVHVFKIRRPIPLHLDTLRDEIESRKAGELRRDPAAKIMTSADIEKDILSLLRK